MVSQKVCLIGEAGVGKTTLVKLLQEKATNGPRQPTIGVAVDRVTLDSNRSLAMWDLAGQRRFQFTWDDFMRGSNLTVVVTDSTPENVAQSREILARHERAAGSKIIAIANKQDLGGRMTPEEIEQALGVPTFGMVAIQGDNVDAMKNILEHVL
jgi:ADP-ribosylation factor-like protein 2